MCETRCLLASRCPAKYRHQVRPAGPNLAVGEEGRRPLPPPGTPPAPWQRWRRRGEEYLVLSRAEVLTRRLLCGAGRGVRRAQGGGVGASGPACSGRCLRLPAAGSAAVPAAAAINLRGRGRAGAGPGPSGHALSSAGKSGVSTPQWDGKSKCACACGAFAPHVSFRPSHAGSGGRPRRLVQSGTRRLGATARDQVPARRIPAAIAQLI